MTVIQQLGIELRMGEEVPGAFASAVRKAADGRWVSKGEKDALILLAVSRLTRLRHIVEKQQQIATEGEPVSNG